MWGGRDYTPDCPSPRPLVDVPELGLVLHWHPRHALDPETVDVLGLWRAFEAGHLPEPGGMFDQPTLLLEYFDICNAAKHALRRRAQR